MKELWKDIPEFETLYQVSNLGRIRSVDRIDMRGHALKGKVLKQAYNKEGYAIVYLSKFSKKKTIAVHRLVAITFLDYKLTGTTAGLICDHKDYDKTNNCLNNLQLITNRQNVSKDKWRKNKTSKYTGVYLHSQRNTWVARIFIKGKQISLGCFKHEIDAHKKYQQALNNL